VVTLPEGELRRRAGRVRLVLSDCDGVLTDGGVYYSDRGEEMKRFSIRDGMGVERLGNAGIASGVMSGERSPSILRRAEKLGRGAHVLLGIKDKRRELGRLLERTGLALDEVAYIGDDMNDLETLLLVGAVGLTAAPADALPAVLDAVHHRAEAKGGHGAFRDFAEWILALRAGASSQGGPV
jgi:3-deoxy-D-manno-octulosonate 8-phosphate phosphatase (KDO 8-P phosphatase)